MATCCLFQQFHQRYDCLLFVPPTSHPTGNTTSVRGHDDLVIQILVMQRAKGLLRPERGQGARTHSCVTLIDQFLIQNRVQARKILYKIDVDGTVTFKTPSSNNGQIPVDEVIIASDQKRNMDQHKSSLTQYWSTFCVGHVVVARDAKRGLTWRRIHVGTPG